MNTKSNAPLHNTIQFEALTGDDQKNLMEADSKVAINMVLDMQEQMKIQEDRRRQATYWRSFAGIVLVLVVILSLMNYTSRKEQVEVFSSLIEASPLVFQDNNKVRLADLKTTLFFYHQLKADYERRISNIKEGKLVLSGTLQNIKDFNRMAESQELDPVTIPHLSNSLAE